MALASSQKPSVEHSLANSSQNGGAQQRNMARDVILLGEVAAKGAAMVDICGRCDRRGRLSVARLLAEWGADASIRDIMRSQIGNCPHRDDAQIYQARAAGTKAGGRSGALIHTK